MPAKSRKVRPEELIPVPHHALDQENRMTDLLRIVEQIEVTMIHDLHEGHPELAWEMLNRLKQFGKVSGVGQAVAMWTLRQNFPFIDEPQRQFNSTEEMDQAFYEIMFVQTGYTPETVRRYVLAWQFMTQIRPKVDDKTWEGYLNRNIIDLIALGQSVREHGPMQKRTLEKLARTVDTGSLRAELRKTWDEESESNAMSWRLAPDGTLEVFQGGDAAYIGFIRPSDGDQNADPIKNSLYARARARLVRKLSIKETV